MNSFTYALSDFDTDIFGFKVAKIESIDSSDPAKHVAALLNDLKKNNISYATYRLDANNFSVIHALEQAGCLLVDGTIAFTLKFAEQVQGGCCMDEAALEEYLTEGNPGYQIIEAAKKDKEQLMKLSSNVFSVNRFYNDPFIPKEKADMVYAKWMENSLNGKAADLVLVYKEKDSILGFVTLQKKGHIPLVGVAAKSRGKGVAKKLVKAALKKFEEWFVDEVAIETQMQNIPAIRVYQSVDFKITNSFLTYRWKLPLS